MSKVKMALSALIVALVSAACSGASFLSSSDWVGYQLEESSGLKFSIAVPKPAIVMIHHPHVSYDADYISNYGLKVAGVLSVAYDWRGEIPRSGVGVSLYDVPRGLSLQGFVESIDEWWKNKGIDRRSALSIRLINGRKWIVLDSEADRSVEFYSMMNGRILTLSLSLSHTFNDKEIAARKSVFEAVVDGFKCSNGCGD